MMLMFVKTFASPAKTTKAFVTNLFVAMYAVIVFKKSTCMTGM